MPYSDAAKNAMLNHLAGLALYASVHETNPGSTGADEASGSVRAALTWGSAGSGSVSISGSPAVSSIPDTVTVNFIGLWSASSGGTWYGYQAVSATSTTTGLPWSFTITVGLLDLNATASA